MIFPFSGGKPGFGQAEKSVKTSGSQTSAAQRGGGVAQELGGGGGEGVGRGRMKIRVVLDSVRDQNLKQMKQLNAAIFPVKYQVSSSRSKVFPFSDKHHNFFLRTRKAARKISMPLRLIC